MLFVWTFPRTFHATCDLPVMRKRLPKFLIARIFIGCDQIDLSETAWRTNRDKV